MFLFTHTKFEKCSERFKFSIILKVFKIDILLKVTIINDLVPDQLTKILTRSKEII